jgi:hypothetical protein
MKKQKTKPKTGKRLFKSSIQSFLIAHLNIYRQTWGLIILIYLYIISNHITEDSTAWLGTMTQQSS